VEIEIFRKVGFAKLVQLCGAKGRFITITVFFLSRAAVP
jgi:hypothetical protein